MKKITSQEKNAVEIMYKKELSAPIIAQSLHLSLSQIYDTLKKRGIPRRNPADQNKIRFLNKPFSFNFKENLSVCDRELMIAALMLYLGEGAKTGNTVDIANSDPLILKIFLKFLKNICRVNDEKLRFYLYCFEDQNKDELINYWVNELQVNRNKFTKPYIRQNHKQRKRKMRCGVLHVRYNDKRLLEKILTLGRSLINEMIL